MDNRETEIRDLQQIEKYIVSVKFKSSLFGGLKRVDVYRQIQQIHQMYQSYVETQQQNSQSAMDEVERLTEKIAKLERENANLKRNYDNTRGSESAAVPTVQPNGRRPMDRDVSGVLEAAYITADRIVRSAKVDAEQEALKIRSGYQEESNMLRNMCEKMEMDLREAQRCLGNMRRCLGGNGERSDPTNFHGNRTLRSDLMNKRGGE